MKLYRATGNSPLLTYFLAENDADALEKAETALWSYELEGSAVDDSIVVSTVRTPYSLQEIRGDKWWNRVPLLIPVDDEELTCEEFMKKQERKHKEGLDSLQVTFFFYDKDWADG